MAPDLSTTWATNPRSARSTRDRRALRSAIDRRRVCKSHLVRFLYLCRTCDVSDVGDVRIVRLGKAEHGKGAVHPQARSMRQRHDPQREIGQFGEPEQLLALGVHDNRAAHRSVSALIRRERRPASTDHPDRKTDSAGFCARPAGPRAAAGCAGPVAHSVPLARSPRSAASRAHGPMRTPTPRRRRPPPMAGRPCSCHQTLLLSLASQLQIRLPVAERDPVFVQHSLDHHSTSGAV
jgi:hypothetical protein